MYSSSMNKPSASEIVPGLLLASTRFSEVLVLAKPTSRGMVRCEVTMPVSGEVRVVSLPRQVLRWQ